MLLYPLSALLNSFPRNFIIKGRANNRRSSSSCPFSVITFIYEEATGCVNEEALGSIKGGSVAPSINRPDFSSDATILAISSIFYWKWIRFLLLQLLSHLLFFHLIYWRRSCLSYYFRQSIFSQTNRKF